MAEQDRGQDGQGRKPGWISQVADAVMTVAGLIMAITPLTLWISPEKEILLFWLGLCAFAGLVVIALAHSGLTDKAGPTPEWRQRERPDLPPEVIARWQNFGHLSRREGEEVRAYIRNRLAGRHDPQRGPADGDEADTATIRFL